MQDAEHTWSQIEQRLGFVPPFFAPARQSPVQLENLWRQTELAYLDNVLPAVFKEKLAALLGRYCEARYCLVCHSCTLRPLGVDGRSVLDLLSAPVASDEELDATSDRFVAVDAPIDFTQLGAADEDDLFGLASSLYFGGATAGRARAALRRRLQLADYQALVAFCSYNKMCHEWVISNPEISHDLDARYQQNHAALEAEAPGLRTFFGAATKPGLSAAEALRLVARERGSEVERSGEIVAARFDEVLEQLERVAKGATEAEHRAQLDEALVFSQELLAVVSHDLRNPLNVILLSAAVVQDRVRNDSKTTSALQRIVSSARRAERLIRDLLDFSQARMGGGLPLYRVDVDLHGLVREVVADSQSAWPERAFVLDVVGDGRASLDADRIIQVLTNLIANAVVHGGADEPIRLAVATSGDSVVIDIVNSNRNGPIPAALLPSLFEPFKAGVRQAASQTRSIGLGLFIVAHVVERHGGTITVESVPAHTRFAIRLPVR